MWWAWVVPGSLTAVIGLLLGGMAVALLAVSAWATAAAQDEDRQNGPEDTGVDEAGLAEGAVPAEYASLVQKWGNLCDALNPALLAAQLYQESNWDPRAQSPAGAQGIAQFMPGTWAAHGMDANKDGKADVWDPQDAIPSAASYDCKIAGYVKEVPGNSTNNMLAAYNAGSYAVIKYDGVPPYKETQNYVKVIREGERSFAAAQDSSRWVAPVAGPVSTRYRATGSSWASGYHTGVDFAVPTGTAVRAVGPGTVVTAGWAKSYGYQVVIRHQDGVYSQYAHLSKVAVAVGDRVGVGERIGLSGSTGNSSGPHLHFEIRTGPQYGSDVDPVKYLRGRGIAL